MIKSAVIGAGHIAQEHLKALQTIDDVDVCVCDRSPGIAQCAAERFGLNRWFTDSQQMLDRIEPDVVHICTPAHTHVPLAMAALDAGAHVLVEKPIAPQLSDWHTLRDCAASAGRWVLENHNYMFNPPIQQLLGQIDDGSFGDVVHVDVMFCLDIVGEGSVFTDANMPHPALKARGGVVSDFITHLCYLAWCFVGSAAEAKTLWQKRDPQTILPHDEFRALLQGERGTATLGFSAHGQPDAFWVHVIGTRATATVNLLDNRLSMVQLREGLRPLMPLRNGLAEAKAIRRDSLRAMKHKLAGQPVGYAGLHELVRRTYRSLQQEGDPPVTVEQIEQVNQMIELILSKAPVV